MQGLFLILQQRTIKMGLFLDAANAWNDLKNVSYILDTGRKGKFKRIELFFLDIDFPHISGMQYAKDVDFGIREAEYYGEKLIPALLTGKLNENKITESRNWNKISGRLTAIINLQQMLDNDFKIVAFNKNKVKPFSQLDAKFAIESSISGDIYFVFLDDRSGRYYCKSAFRKEITDYIENQSPITLLQKVKLINDIPTTLFIKPGYEPI